MACIIFWSFVGQVLRGLDRVGQSWTCFWVHPKIHNTTNDSKLSISEEENNDETEDDFNTNPEVEENELDYQIKDNQYNDS